MVSNLKSKHGGFYRKGPAVRCRLDRPLRTGQACGGFLDFMHFLIAYQGTTITLYSEIGNDQCESTYACFFEPQRGGTPLDGLNGDVRPDRVWFSENFVLNGVSISSIFVSNRVSLHDLTCMYSLTTEPSRKPNFANVQHIEMRNSL